MHLLCVRMIQYKRCTEVEWDSIYKAFQVGFSDYIINISLAQEAFIARFFGPEGNRREHSFLALNGNEPIGLILGGIKMYEGIQTMRCGALAIHPAFRGKQISHTLFTLHKEEALRHGCKQLFLEVIVGNDRALHFYNKLGYEKVYDLSYYYLHDASRIETGYMEGMSIRKLSFAEFQNKIHRWLSFHINWQNDVDYMEKSANNTYYGAYIEGRCVGCICVNPEGKISFLFVEEGVRGKGIASSLLCTAREEERLTAFSIGFPNNGLLEGFVKKRGFARNALAQYEMYLVL